MSKFSALGINVTKPYRMPIIYPGMDDQLTDNTGKPAYLDLLSADSEIGRKIDVERARQVNKKVVRQGVESLDDENQLERNIAKQAALTFGWYLVDPNTREPIDIPFNKENAIELYSDNELGWLFRAAVAASNGERNFSKRSAKTSSGLPSTDGVSIAGEKTEQAKEIT